MADLAAGAGVTRRRAPRRLVTWVSLAIGAVAALLVGVLAVSRSSGSDPGASRIVGGPAPALSGTLLPTGHPVTLSQYAGRWVLVDFAASWCAACREELPQLKAFAAGAATRSATVLTVEDDASDGAHLVRYLASQHAGWPIVSDTAAPAAWGVAGIPSLFLVDPDGIVVAYYPSVPPPATLDKVIAAGSPGSGTSP